MANAYIIDAVRTPVARKGGALSGVHPADLGAHVLRSLVERSGIPAEAVEDVIFGCVGQIGSQAWNLARTSWLSAGLPDVVPGVTIDRQCGSSQQAVDFAAQGVKGGAYDLVIAGGVELMSLVTLNSSADSGPALGFGHPFGGDGFRKYVTDDELNQFTAAEKVAEKFGVTRDEMERFALESHQRAARAVAEGRFEREIIPYGESSRDECIRETTLEKMASLKTLVPGGHMTAALASQISDGAAGLLIASEDAVVRYGLTPRARVHTSAVVGGDPVLMLTAPMAATAKALSRAKMTIDDMDLYECNEAFAPVVLAWQKDTGARPERTNVNGGAIALGHPLGASGARLMTTLLNELERTGGRFGLQTMCEGGGMSNCTIIERI